jgi:hypothetical protein
MFLCRYLSNFLSGGIGVAATGGSGGGIGVNATTAGSCSKSGAAPGTLTARTGGAGQANSSGSFVVMGITYNYGGGGRLGGTNGGLAGLNGIAGGTGNTGTKVGQNATGKGSGGGGGGRQANAGGGSGGPGLVIITFTYP